MIRFWRHLRVPVLVVLLGGVLAGCNTTTSGGLGRGIVQPALCKPGQAVAGGIGGGIAGALILAGMTRNPSYLMTAGAVGVGALAGGLGLPAATTALDSSGVAPGTRVIQGQNIYEADECGTLRMVGSVPPTVSVAGAGYGYPQPGYSASSGGLPVDNPVNVRACQPTAQAPARAVTSNGTPWVSCARLGAGPPLFR